MSDQEQTSEQIQAQTEMMRTYDPGKAGVKGCDGYFEPENRQPHGPMRPGKTYEDRLPVDRRQRVKKAKGRAERMRNS